MLLVADNGAVGGEHSDAADEDDGDDVDNDNDDGVDELCSCLWQKHTYCDIWVMARQIEHIFMQ